MLSIPNTSKNIKIIGGVKEVVLLTFFIRVLSVKSALSVLLCGDWNTDNLYQALLPPNN
jgi:hypothetical protein